MSVFWDTVYTVSSMAHSIVVLCFLSSFNNLDSGIKSWILKFADDRVTKIFNRVNCTADVEILQTDLHTLITCSEEWRMLSVNQAYACWDHAV